MMVMKEYFVKTSQISVGLRPVSIMATVQSMKDPILLPISVTVK